MEKRVCISDLKVDDQIRFGSKVYPFLVRAVESSAAGTKVSYSPVAIPEVQYSIDMASSTVVYKIVMEEK